MKLEVSAELVALAKNYKNEKPSSYICATG